MRIAYFSPTPPEQSGISDYSVELLEHLAKLVDIDVFTHAAETTTRDGWNLYPYSAYEVKSRREPYQLNVYAMGNNYEFHDEIFDFALREPGLVVMHDLTLYGFYTFGFGARRDLLAQEVRYAHGARGLAEWRPVADQYMRVDRLKINLLRRIAERSRGLIAHSQWGCEQLRRVAPDTPVYHVPLGLTVSATQPSGSRAVRARLGIADDALVAGIFGHIEPEKRVVQAIEAFSDVVKQRPEAHLLIAGRNQNIGYRAQVASAIARAHLDQAVILLGSPSLEEFETYMQACDVIISLRWPTSGESSAIMARAMGLGKLIVTSDIPQFREFSDRFCWRIPHEDRVERTQLVEALLKVADHSEFVLDARQAALEYAQSEAEWSLVGRRYATIIEQVADTPPTPGKADADVDNPLHQVTGVNCIGDITSEAGLGAAALQMVRTIMGEGIATSFIEREFPSSTRDLRALDLVKKLPTSPIYPTNILFYNINDMHLLSNADLKQITGGRYMIARWFWELSQLSDEWIKRISRVDEIWVSSVFTQKCMQSVTDKPVTVIPATVEVPISPAAVRADFHLPEDRFIYIFTFAATSTAARKNPFAVIDAFEQAFGYPEGKGSPYLVIKAHYVDEYPELKEDLTAALRRVGGLLISENLSRQETNDLLACTDCYVSLHRAEGFGLGPAEAMYLGKPVIATNYSGNVDFMTNENSYLVDYEERKIVADDHQYNAYGHLVYQVGMVWAEPNIAHAARLMRQVIENPEERTARGMRAASDIRAQFSHEAVGRLIRRRLAEIEREKPTPTKDLSGDGALESTLPHPSGVSLPNLQHHIDAIGSLEWSRTRDKAIPLGKVKGLGTLLRVLARVLVQGRINERQQWINNDALQEVRFLADEVAALTQEVATLKEQAGSITKLFTYTLQYGTTIGSITEQAPELGRYPLVSLSEEVDGKTHMLVEAISQTQLRLRERNVAAFPQLKDAEQYSGIAWYHATVGPYTNDRASFFQEVNERLNDNDAFILLSSVDAQAPYNVGPLHVMFDGLVAGKLRATAVRRPRVERRRLASGYDLYYSADDPGFISADLRTLGEWEPSETELIRQHVKPGSTVIDVGANVGYFTILAARLVGSNGRVVAVEPDPVSVGILRKNVGLLPNPEIVQVVEAAAGDISGWTRLYRSPTNHGDHRVFQVVGGDAVHDAGKPRGIGVSVPLRRMDEILADVPRVDFIKVDTQGFDYAALKSMESILQRDHPIIICEFWPYAMQQAGYDPYEFRDMLLRLNYRLYRLSRQLDGDKPSMAPITLDEATVTSLPETGDLNIVAVPSTHVHELAYAQGDALRKAE